MANRRISTRSGLSLACVCAALGMCAMSIGALQASAAGAATQGDPAAQARWNKPPCTQPTTTTTTEVTTSTQAPTTTSTVAATTTTMEVKGSTTLASTTTAPAGTTAATVSPQGSTVPPTTAVAPAAVTLPRTGANSAYPLLFGLSALMAGALLLRRRCPRWSE